MSKKNVALDLDEKTEFILVLLKCWRGPMDYGVISIELLVTGEYDATTYNIYISL